MPAPSFQPFCLQVPCRIYEEMVNHARRELPNECCGLIAGTPPATDSTVAIATRLYRLVNELASPSEYLSEPRSLLHATRDMREQGIDILAVYHSHPKSAPVPSKKDLVRCFYRQAMQFIISLLGDEPEVRAWWLQDESFTEAEWHIVADAARHGA